MYAFISGILEEIGQDGLIVVSNRGIGYNIFVSGNTLSKLPRIGCEVKIFTHTHVKEDELSLYGFLYADEKRMFEKLINISGVGCKMAMGVLSGVDSATLALAIANGDVSGLSKIKGVGKKTAERIILELKEKIDVTELAAGGALDIAAVGDKEYINDAVSALVSLGINKTDAYKAVVKVADKAANVNGLITLALRSMDR